MEYLPNGDLKWHLLQAKNRYFMFRAIVAEGCVAIQGAKEIQAQVHMMWVDLSFCDEGRMDNIPTIPTIPTIFQ